MTEREPLISAVSQSAPSYQGNDSVDVEVEVVDEIEATGNLDMDTSMWDRSVHYVTNAFSRSLLQRIIGVVLVMCAGFSFTSSNVLQKFSVRHLTFWQLLANRAILQFIGMGTFCFAMHIKSRSGADWSYMFLGPRGVRRRTVLQGMLGGVLLACMFVAVKFVPLGNASAIMFCTPVFTFFMAPCMLPGREERLGIYRMFITLLMSLGVLFITRPDAVFGPSFPQTNATRKMSHIMPDDALPGIQYLQQINPPPQPSNRTIFVQQGPALIFIDLSRRDYTWEEILAGYICCVAVPLLSAFISLITRQCNLAKVPVYVLMFWFGVGATTVVTIATTALNQFTSIFNVDFHELMVMTCITILGIFGNMCYTFAVKFVSPSLANVFRSFEVILNFALQVILEKSPYYNINFVGIALLLMAVLVMSYENRAQIRWRHAVKYL